MPPIRVESPAPAEDSLPFPAFAGRMPASDRVQLVGLSGNEVQGRALARSDEYCNLAFDLLSLYNALTPIHRALPAEVLAEIFVQYAIAEYPTPLAIIHVSRSWRAIALDTPRFWAALAGSRVGPLRSFLDWSALQETERESRLAYITSVLRWSKATPLFLRFNRGFPDPPTRVLHSHRGRIVHLDVYIDSFHTFNVLFIFLSSHRKGSSIKTLSIRPPKHTKFIFTYGSIRSIFPEYDLRGDNFPVLRTLDPIPLDLLPYFPHPTLREVNIVHPLAPLSTAERVASLPPPNTHLNQGELLVFALRRCPRLEKLTFSLPPSLRNMHLHSLQQPQSEWDAAQAWQTAEKATLPSLRQLEFYAERGPAVCFPFLALLSIPSHVNKVLSFDALDNGADTLWAGLSKDENLAQTLFRSVPECDLWVASSVDSSGLSVLMVALMSEDAGQELKIEFVGSREDEGAPLERLRPLLEVICARGTPSLLTIALKLHRWEAASQATELLLQFPSLTRLALHGPWAHLLLSALAAEQPCCPFLRELEVRFSVNSRIGHDGHALWEALNGRPEGWEEVIRATLATHRASLASVLSRRAACGAVRLERLCWGENAWRGEGKAYGWEWDQRCSGRIEAYDPGRNAYGVKELERLVDGVVDVLNFTYESTSV